MKFFNLFHFILISLIIHTSLQGEKIVNDFGDSDDFSTSAAIYLIREAWESNYNIPGDDADFIHQETDTGFWIFTDAPTSLDLINARVIRMTTYAEFQANAINQGDTVYLGIRYKDNLPAVYGAMPVYSHNGTDWVEIGELGGEFDHKWKVAVITVEPQNVSVTNGKYRFKMGTGLWSTGLTGDIPVDRIELASSSGELTVEPDKKGFYPAEGDGNFPGLTKDSCWYVDNKPFFPVGFAAGWNGISDNSWQDMADAGFNTVLFYNWMIIQDPYAAGDVWDSLPSSGHYGFSEFLNKSEEAGLKVIGVFQNDIKYLVVQNYFNTEAATLQFITDVCAMHKNHPALLAWSPVDEPDHSQIPEFYAPLEWCMAIKNAIRNGDPDHPIYALEMAWRKGGFGHYKDICDYQGYDVYPEFGESVSLIGERADLLVEETNGEKPYISFLKAYERTAEQAYMSFAEAYIALIHGAKGIFYWSYSGSTPIWDTLSKIANEIDSLNNVLLPPAFTIDVNGKNNICTNTQPNQVQNIYNKGSDGIWYILSTNIENQAVNNVQFTVEGLAAGEEVQVLFENRTITTSAGTFQDNFLEYGRHVYQISAITPIKEPFLTSNISLSQVRIFNNTKHFSNVVFLLDGRQNALLQIYNTQGKLINTLQGTANGNHVKWVWNRKDICGRQVSGNIYFIRIQLGANVVTKRFILFD